MEYPSGELVSFDYDTRAGGWALGETQLTVGPGNHAVPSVTYRQMTASTPSWTVQRLGNGVSDYTLLDESTGAKQLVASTSGTFTTAPSARNCAAQAAASVRCIDYEYDQFLNLQQQNKYLYPQGGGTSQIGVSEQYTYDGLQRLTAESRSYINVAPNTSASESYTYDAAGDFQTKSDFGTYAYADATRPHRLTSVSGGMANWTYTYDGNGNIKTDGWRSLTYDAEDRPATIQLQGTLVSSFYYTPDGERYLQRIDNTGSSNRTIYYVGKDYERVEWDAQLTEERTYVGPSTVVGQQSGRQVFYLHLDRLGSPDATTNEQGTLAGDTECFDAFGKPRQYDCQPRSWNQEKLHPNGEYGIATSHGFTGHEHLDETLLIHMNGRAFDYRLGRFLSVDPIIGNPANPQSMNPYSYIGNNPLSGVDPTGYCATGQSSELGSNICQVNANLVVDAIKDGLATKKITNETSPQDAEKALGMAKGSINEAATQIAHNNGSDVSVGSSAASFANKASPDTKLSPGNERQTFLSKYSLFAHQFTAGFNEQMFGAGFDNEGVNPDSLVLRREDRPFGEEVGRQFGKFTGLVGDVGGLFAVASEGPSVVMGEIERGLGLLTASEANEIGILREAGRGSNNFGNFGLGAADAQTATHLGEAYVGEGAQLASDGKTLVSSDGLKQFRPPSWKPSRGTFQANFEQRLTPDGRWISNGHLDIQYGPPEPPK
jgi:RHS repeat-associated protein